MISNCQNVTNFGREASFMSKIFFHYNVQKFRIEDSGKVKNWLDSVLDKEKKKYERIDYIFCNNEFILQINRKFFQHDYFTDIITFNLGDKLIRGEIYISIETVFENALLYSVSFKEEMLRVLVHGILHLCGHNDKTKKEKIFMRKREDETLGLFL